MSERVKSVVTGLAPRLSSGRTALFLYVLLVVLPAVVFGGLLWRQLRLEQERVLAALPEECVDAAERLAASCRERLESELANQNNRGFEIYREEYFKDELGPVIPIESPLAVNPRPVGVLGWFSFRVPDPNDGVDVDDVEISVFRGKGASTGLRGSGATDPIGLMIQDVARDHFVADFVLEEVSATEELERADMDGWGQLRPRRLRTVVLNVASGPVEDCRQALEDAPELWEERRHDVYVSYYEFRAVRTDESSQPLLIAFRRVVMPLLALPLIPSCFEALDSDLMFVQAVVFDPDWLFTTMPSRVANNVLGQNHQFLPSVVTRGQDPDLVFHRSNIFNYLQPITYDSLETFQLGGMFVAGDAGARREGFRVRNAWFGSVALILTISMAIGIRLLLLSIRRSRQEAERTRNFVASVTHELRTPIAAVKLYGEMLSDGWIKDEAKRGDYLKRIVAESDRLDGLVDRVLLRRRLSDRDHEPSAGSLNAEIEQLRPSLEMVGGRAADDIEFDLAKDLPKVLLLPEGVHVVLTNLVENARKYAPVQAGTNGTPADRILVRTRLSRKGRVLLEVLDRGPGIPEEDRDRVFEAFLRLGDEATRKTKGTGLGLHLVALQARAMRARVRALPRSGGGTVFQVIFAKG